MAEPVLQRLTLAHLEDVLLVEQLSFTDPWSRESYRYELAENELAHYYGCFLDRRLLGFGGFWQILTEGHIANVAVHPDFRSKGLGKLLVAHLMTACRALGGTAMTLEVRQSNAAARELYRKFGFTSAGVRPGYYNDRENAVIMWADLEAKD
ncbi:MAG: ribosomal protein S18-alanine N-acetyltransferase [Clostridiales bacterium]|nr:ribosomal protein S18-alanine N-acetyltransferase [Clostridiales bacterium]